MEHSGGVGLGRRKAGRHGANVVPMYEILKKIDKFKLDKNISVADKTN